MFLPLAPRSRMLLGLFARRRRSLAAGLGSMERAGRQETEREGERERQGGRNCHDPCLRFTYVCASPVQRFKVLSLLHRRQAFPLRWPCRSLWRPLCVRRLATLLSDLMVFPGERRAR
ncbi:hypothetical protein GGS23DRAFT_514204 [Durotheca rogersii]|uniref:uncharacterized protein n=1 Tax=Durotheca rogersii TaxID=419775 RepID=UPI00221FDB56|nr:uncharacterized protein GGS23DRAFT_514204 [Durotheca rogersii]KAI5863793.1 hypothetical protein GGS23DRAFT_514204 [Durotheca rogersii]